MNKDYAVHPGVTMKYILISMGKNQKWLSEQMNMSKVIISELINQKRTVTPRIALAFEKATTYPAEKLLMLQVEYDLYNERMKNCDGIERHSDEEEARVNDGITALNGLKSKYGL